MDLKMNTLLIALFGMLASHAAAEVFDVTKNGAAAGNPDNAEALLTTWKAACASPTASKVVIPAGVFKVSAALLAGPCKAPIEFNLEGTLQAPEVGGPGYKPGVNWVAFEYVDFLTISGKGIFDGQGKSAWGKKCGNQYCGEVPMNLRFSFMKKTILQDVTSKDSKQFHINLLGVDDFTIQNFHVVAPGDSLNTDGIHVGRSNNVKIIDTTIETGDDCISIGDGTKNITITGVTCGPGHGISVGSLGKFPNEEPVVGVFVTHCTLKNTMNGVRIKTWPDSKPGSASDMHFEDITMENVGNPVLIDQEYCPAANCKNPGPSKVKISNVSFKKIKGTSSTPLGLKLVCSPGIPCENIVVADIDLKYAGGQGQIASECKNVKPTAEGTQSPKPCAESLAS